MTNWKFELKNKLTGVEYEIIGVENYEWFIFEATEVYNLDHPTKPQKFEIAKIAPSVIGFTCTAERI